MYFDNGNIALSVMLGLSDTCNDILWKYIDKNANRPFRTGERLNDVLINLNNCCSEIEKIFCLSLQLLLLDVGEDFVEVVPQYDIFIDSGRYVADFIVFDRINPLYKLVIECDGHSFHEKAKKQVEKDNKRDYDLKMSGYDILHFSGSTLYNKTEQCAKDVFNYIKAKTGRCLL